MMRGPEKLRPLDDLFVLAFEHAIAGPLCTRQLADLGARVIKVERRENGDFARAYDARVKGLSSHFVWTNRSKESLTLDIKKPDAKHILQKLLQHTDVLVQNLAPGALAKLGMTYTDLQEQFPQLIVCDISGYGATGPFANRKAYDLMVQGEAGFLSVTGDENNFAKAGISIADISAATQACNSILAAVRLRDRTGKGSHIEISLLESMAEWMGFPLYYAFQGASAPARTGSDHASIYPYGRFRCGDSQQLVLGLQNEREWHSFCHGVLRCGSLADDPRFDSNAKRSEQRGQLRSLIEGVLADLDTQQLVSRLEQAGIAYARINDMQELWNHPQLRARDRQVTVESEVGEISAFLPPGTNNSFSHRMDRIPALGQDTEHILSELGYSKEDIARLRAEQVT